MADVENVDMIEVDENDKIETLDFAVDQGDCVVYGGGASENNCRFYNQYRGKSTIYI